MVKRLETFSKAKEMAAGSISYVHQALSTGWGLLSMVVGGRYKAGLPKSDGKVSFNHS